MGDVSTSGAFEGVIDLGPRLRRCPLFTGLDDAALDALTVALQIETASPGERIVAEDAPEGDMFVILDGQAVLQRRQADLRLLNPGDFFGDIALLTGKPRAASAVARSPMVLARLTSARFHELSEQTPALALHLTQGLISRLGDQLMAMTDNVGLLLQERSLPRRAELDVRVMGRLQPVATGTTVGQLLPAAVDGHRVVAGLIDQKPVSLNTPLTSEAAIEPLTTAHWEGERIFRRSVGLLLLEAAARMDRRLKLQIGASLGQAQEVSVSGFGGDRAALAVMLTAAMHGLIAEDVPVRQEWWTVEEAVSQFAEWGWTSAAKLLKVWRDANVLLVSCGRVYGVSLSPLVPRTGMLTGFRLEPRGEGLLLSFDDVAPVPTILDVRDVPDRDGETMVREHRNWLQVQGVTSVGAFNDHCISGHVSQLIRISEGFHEKRIGRLADAITGRPKRVRLIATAGPSSSGKTTFIKRLTIQLQINGINPVGISLDDYYRDRDQTPRDATGDYDFESFDALDRDLFKDQLVRLLRGETVKLARYDFLSGKSLPEGGAELQLGPQDVLLIEGIHGLNPALIDGLLASDEAFRIFIQPVTSLPFDHATPFSVSDLRLIRRIVRDRHQRGSRAADNIMRWPSVRKGEQEHIFPFLDQADAVFDSSLIYEPSVLKVYAERYLLEVPPGHPAYMTAYRLRQMIDRFVSIYPDHVPSTSILREFIGGSGFEA